VIIRKGKILLFLMAVAIFATGLTQCKSKATEYYMLVGTYTHTDSKGIYVMKFNNETGKITPVSTQDDIKNPSYLTISGDFVYAVSETNGDTPGGIYAYHFDRKTGQLHFLNNKLTGGDDPCYVEADSSGKFVAVANYSGGSLTLFRTDDKGALSGNKQFIQHVGGSVNPARQFGPHVHETVFSPDQKYLLTPDLGKDKVMVYQFDRNAAEPLTLYKEITTDSGAGPRHITFHPTLPYAYLIDEMIPFVTAFSYSGGDFTQIQKLPTWPENFTGKKDGAELKVSPDGKFLYISHRGDQNEIGIYSIDQKTGKITLKGTQPDNGKGPRDFEIDPSGKFLLVANQQTNNIVTYKVNKETGLLTEVSNMELPIPVCIKFTSMQ